LQKDGRVKDYRALTAARREQLLGAWRRVQQNYAPARENPEFSALLGDKDAMQRIAAEKEAAGRGIDLQQFPWPEILIYVGPQLLKNEPIDPHASIHTPVPVSLELPQQIWHFIAGEKAFAPNAAKEYVPVLDEHGNQVYYNVRTEFSEETIAWARRLQSRSHRWDETSGTSLPAYLAERELMRDWWRENEGHFLRRDFKAVRPGRELPEPKTATTEASAQKPVELGEAAASRPLPSTPPSVEHATAGYATRPSVLSLGAAFVVAVIAGLLFFWKRRCR
jgi:hypothetical protein